MRRRTIALCLACLGSFSCLATGAAQAADSDKVDVSRYLRAADKVKVASGSLEDVTTFAKVVVEPDGDRYGVIDLRAPDAPTGQLDIDGHILDELGLQAIRIVGEQLEGYEPTKNRDRDTVDAASDPSLLWLNRNVWENGKWYYYWATEWSVVNVVYQATDYWPSGEPKFGCANNTNEDSSIECSLKHTSSYTTQLSSSLTASKLLQLGFQKGYSKSTEVTFRINPVRSHSIYKATPMVERDKKGWNESSTQYRCVAADEISTTCIEPRETVRTYTTYAWGYKPRTVFLELSRDDYYR